MNANTIIPIDNGFIDDDWAKVCEPFQQPHEFLYSGRNAVVGQRTETQLQMAEADGGGWCRIRGIVTHVGDPPTFESWMRTSSIAQVVSAGGGISSPDAMIPQMNQSLSQFMEMTSNLLGGLNGQTMTSFGYLDYAFRRNAHGMVLPFDLGRIYKVEHCFDERYDRMWIVTSVQDVTQSMPIAELPKVFKDWDQGRKSGFIAPFDLVGEARVAAQAKLAQEQRDEHENGDY